MAKLSFVLALVAIGVAAAAPSYSRRYTYYPDNYNYDNYNNNNNFDSGFIPTLYSSGSSRIPRVSSDFYRNPYFSNQGYRSSNNYYPGYNNYYSGYPSSSSYRASGYRY
ncbi:unnamed protein product [Meganyctiphanes norvegica]|uniref:Prisilkin-39-like n=1 Tax=Meganyctiphanes norvegica TaxID=48144 RepID=A0AAV2RVW0_MEGNR